MHDYRERVQLEPGCLARPFDEADFCKAALDDNFTICSFNLTDEQCKSLPMMGVGHDAFSALMAVWAQRGHYEFIDTGEFTGSDVTNGISQLKGNEILLWNMLNSKRRMVIRGRLNIGDNSREIFGAFLGRGTDDDPSGNPVALYFFGLVSEEMHVVIADSVEIQSDGTIGSANLGYLKKLDAMEQFGMLRQVATVALFMLHKAVAK